MTHRITLLPGGTIIEAGEDETILDAADRAGIKLPRFCRAGKCATCKARILSGDVDLGEYSPHALLESEVAAGWALLCQAIALEDVTVETRAGKVIGP